MEPEPMPANRDVRIVRTRRGGDAAGAAKLDHVSAGVWRACVEGLHELEPARLDDLRAQERRRENSDRPGDLAAQFLHGARAHDASPEEALRHDKGHTSRSQDAA